MCNREAVGDPLERIQTALLTLLTDSRQTA